MGQPGTHAATAAAHRCHAPAVLSCRVAPCRYSEFFIDHVRKVREAFPRHTITAGNVVTGEIVEELLLIGADIVS